jgi:DNA polymerase I
MSRPTTLPAPGSADALYLVDLSNYVFRAFHAIAPLTNSKGEPTNATYGTVSMLSKLVDDRKPAYLGVAMDSPGPSTRKALDPRYKAHRPAPPPELVHQLKRCKEIVEAYGIPIFYGDGVEADDCIAVAVMRAKARGLRVVVASSDKDLLQLVDEDKVVCWDAMRDRVFGPPEVIAKLGVPPNQVRDLLALVGDSSDNIPGVPGIGMKTGAELLAQFGSMEGIYKNLDQVKRAKIRENLVAHEADARLSQQLVSLDPEAPCDLDPEKLRYGGADTTRLRELFTELEFTRFLKAVPAPALVTEGFKAITTRAELEAFVAEARAKKLLAIEVHGAPREAMRAHITGLAMAADKGKSVYLPLGHRYLGAPPQLALDDVRQVLGPLLADAAIAKVGHDVKFTEVALLRHGMPLGGVRFDSMLASYLLDPEAPNELQECAERDAGVTMRGYEAVTPKKRGAARGLDEVEVDEAARYAGQFPAMSLELEGRYTPRLEEAGLGKLYRDIEMPLATVLARMEHAGVLIDPGALEGMGVEMGAELARLEERAKEAAGGDLNLASPKQLEQVLFDQLGLKVTRRTRTGRSTDAEALEAITDDHPLPGIVLEHRAIAKLKGTYVDALPRLVHPETGRIHTRWSQAVAATGRLSSQDPNVQNIPIRTALGKTIRRAFVAPKGSVFLTADYSQIELRVLAHLSHDPVLVDAFQHGKDVHVATAMAIFGVDEKGVTDEMRRRSKTVNFGVIYGMGETALAKRLGITRQEAHDFIQRYFERYRGVHELMEKTMAEARRTETVYTLLGRRRILPDLRSSDRGRRSYAERIAGNTPIQGTAADLLKLAMVRLADPVVPGAKMVLTVHDELAFEVPEKLVEEARAKIKTAMETVFPLDVPLVVDVGWGATWADAH